MAIDVDALWDYGKPEVSESRFRAALDAAGEDDRLVLQTQIARTYGLRRDFSRAREVLATVEAAWPRASAEVRVRFLLELGRSYLSPVHPPELRTPENIERAGSSSLNAYESAAQAKLDDLAIDALHMMAFVDDDPARQLAWNEKALAVLEKSDQAKAKRWEASLRHNVGHAKRLSGDHEGALHQFRLSRAAHERAGRSRSAGIADWMIARTYRDQKRFAEAIAVQLALERAWQADPDPYVFEELELLYRAVGDEPRAQHYGERLKATRR